MYGSHGIINITYDHVKHYKHYITYNNSKIIL